MFFNFPINISLVIKLFFFFNLKMNVLRIIIIYIIILNF